jgi:hypothetical protein
MDYTGNANVVKNWEEIYNLVIDNTWQVCKFCYNI